MAGKKGPRIHWDKQEREDWQAALELEAAQGGQYATIAAAAMKHMKRPRPMSPELIKEAGIAARKAVALRIKQAREREGQKQAAEQEAAVEPEVAPVSQEVIASSFPETVIQEPAHWSEAFAEDLSRLLIETIVRTAESPAVRKAVRSLIQVASSRDFHPEVDNTTKWEAPKIGPRLPRILVVGFWKIGPVRSLSEQFGKLLDLRFWRTDDSLNQLRGDLQNAEHVLLVAGTSNHTVRQIIVSSGKPLTTLPLAGGASMARRELQRFVDLWKKDRGDSHE